MVKMFASNSSCSFPEAERRTLTGLAAAPAPLAALVSEI